MFTSDEYVCTTMIASDTFPDIIALCVCQSTNLTHFKKTDLTTNYYNQKHPRWFASRVTAGHVIYTRAQSVLQSVRSITSPTMDGSPQIDTMSRSTLLISVRVFDLCSSSVAMLWKVRLAIS